MPNLVPEKRVDRNGRLVTRHVRSGPVEASSSASLPSPASVAVEGREGDGRSSELRSRQQRQYAHRLKLKNFPSVDILRDRDQQKTRPDQHTDFTASEEEFYDVLSATKATGVALDLLERGIRSAREARDYLNEIGSAYLIDDLSGLTQEALRRGISPQHFAYNYETLNANERKSPHVIDLVEFRHTGLNLGGNALVGREILAGNVSYDDIKSIGIGKLVDQGRAYNLLVVLEAVHKGENKGYALDDIADLVDRSIAEDSTYMSFSTAVDTMFNLGADSIKGLTFDALDEQHYHYFRSDSIDPRIMGTSRHRTFELMAYSAQVRSKLAERISDKYVTDEYCDAGIPVEIAADVLSSGGGLTQAKAIHEEGIENSLSGGWL